MTSDPRISSNRYNILTLEWPYNCLSLEDWLIEQCAKAPALMQEIAVVLQPSLEHHANEIGEAVKTMSHMGIKLVGLTGDSSHRTIAYKFGLAWFSAYNVVQAPNEIPEAKNLTATRSDSPMIIDGPVRSGMQIYAEGQDLIVVGQVSEGAEIMADGHVHVYGRLRGRVAAGVGGQFDAQIFCQVFEPELVSLAGIYCGADQIPSGIWSARVRVSLEKSAHTFRFELMG